MQRNALVLLVLILSSGCGFHLRGSQFAKLDIDSVYIKDRDAPRLAQQIKTQLQSAGATVAESSAQASHVITLSNETLNRNVLSVDAQTGKVEEYELVLTAKVSIETGDGAALVKNESLQITHDFTFDEGAVLGKFTEQQVIEEDMIRRGASRVLRRLQIIASRATE